MLTPKTGPAGTGTPTSTPTSSGGTTAAPTGSGATATPTAASATASPTAVPTATPTNGATSVPGGGGATFPPGTSTAGNLNCTAANEPVPGNYTDVFTEGTVAGNTYTQDNDIGGQPTPGGFYDVEQYSTPSPTPSPSISPTFAPTPIVSTSPTITPGPTGTPIMATIYVGEYTVGGFSGTSATTSMAYTAAPTSGCFFAVLEQPVGGTAGQFRHRNLSSGATDNAIGIGTPQFATDPQDDGFVATGSITTFTITNLTTSTGTGAFTLDNGTAGTAVVTGSETADFSPDDVDAKDPIHKAFARIRRAEAYRQHYGLHNPPG